MRILMPSIVDPATARSGAGTVTRNLTRLLEAPPLRGSVECVAMRPYDRRTHRLRQTGAIARSLGSGLPAKAAYTHSRVFRERVVELAAHVAFDLIMINGSDLLWLHPLLPVSIPRLLVAHNIEHLLFAAQAQRVAGWLPILRPLARRECRRMERFELDGIRSTHNVIFLSSYDEACARDLAGDLTSLVVPPLFTDPPFAGTRPASEGDLLEVGFLGNMAWWPNRLGLSWYLRDVHPRIGRPVRLHLFGDGTQGEATGDTRVARHGPVVDLSAVWSRCDLMICPMHAGGGVSIKLAEAIYNGMPVLATTFATRGLPLSVDPCLTVLDGKAEWIAYLNDVDARVLRSQRISATISSRFRLASHQDRVQEFVRGLLANAPEPEATAPHPA